MYSIILVIVRKLLNIYLNKAPYKISSAQKVIIEERVSVIRKLFPCDFNRKPRSFQEFDRFKASEFRHIVMYTGILISKDILEDEMYSNFLIFMYILRIFFIKF